MRIWLLIDTYSSLYCWQWMGHHNHEYIIYRDQLHQNSSQTTLSHHHTMMKQWLEYLVAQWVDHIICPPVIELHYSTQYPQITPIFQNYLTHVLQHSTVGKIWFTGNYIQCESINIHWWEIKSSYTVIPKQINNHHFNPNFPIWSNNDIHLPHRLNNHKPDHPTCNQLIKSILRPLKDASVDTVIWLDWAYYACDVSRTHHCRHIKRHRSDTLKSIFENLISPEYSWTYSVAIHNTGTLRDLQQNKKLWWMFTRGQNSEIKQVSID